MHSIFFRTVSTAVHLLVCTVQTVWQYGRNSSSNANREDNECGHSSRESVPFTFTYDFAIWRNVKNWSCFVYLMAQRVSCSTFNIQVTFMSCTVPGQKQWSAIHNYWKNIFRCFSRGRVEDMSVTWMLSWAWNLEFPRTCWLKDQLFISNQKPWHCHSVRAQVVISNINQYRGGDGIWVEMLEMTTETYL